MLWCYTLQKRFLLTHHCLHHVWLRVAQRFGSEEHVCHAVVTNHFQDHGASTESTAPTATIPAPGRANRDTHTQTHTHCRSVKQKHEWPNKDVQSDSLSEGGATEWNVTVWLSTDQACCQKKAKWQTFKMNIWVKFSLKYRSGNLIRYETSNTQPDL